jgi:hypothetical protein
MAKANLVLPNGTTVDIEGTADEVATLLDRFSGAGATGAGLAKPAREQKAKKLSKGNKPARRKGAQSLIHDLAQDGYFKSKRSLGDVQKKLEEKGHIYSLAAVSVPLLRATRGKVLRRIKEKDGWAYVS